MTSCACQGTERCSILANEAASSPRNTATTAAASAACASSASSAAAYGAASAASATSGGAASAAMATTAPSRELHAGAERFTIDEMEGGEADVGEFFFAERRDLTRREARSLNVCGGYGCCRCASR